MKSKVLALFVVLVLAAAVLPGVLLAREGTMFIEGVPDDASSGRYDTQNNIFYGDVREYEGARIRILMDDTEIFAVVLEWHTNDDFMKATSGVRVLQNETVITSDVMEYFGDLDEAHFLGNVVVEMDDGTFSGQRFVLNLETEEMQFFGSFSGEFRN